LEFSVPSEDDRQRWYRLTSRTPWTLWLMGCRDVS